VSFLTQSYFPFYTFKYTSFFLKVLLTQSQKWTLGSLFENYESSPKFWQLFNTVKFMHSLWKNRIGLHFGRFFFKNSSGHPGQSAKVEFFFSSKVFFPRDKKSSGNNFCEKSPDSRVTSAFVLVDVGQGDQMTFEKKSPITWPNPFLVKINTHFLLRKIDVQECGLKGYLHETANFSQTT
jgi:hypothetical protein